jgi:hypothetical protein
MRLTTVGRRTGRATFRGRHVGEPFARCRPSDQALVPANVERVQHEVGIEQLARASSSRRRDPP